MAQQKTQSDHEVDPHAVKDAHEMWQNFCVLVKWSALITAVVLIAMAIFLV